MTTSDVKGYTIINSSTFEPASNKDLPFYVSEAHLIYTKSIIVLLGGTEKFSEKAKEIVLWNDRIQKEMVRLSYKTPILNVCARKDYLTVILENKVYVHTWDNCTVFDNFATKKNEKGIYAMNYDTDVAILVVPSDTIGGVEIHNYDTNKKISVKQHRNCLDILRINGNGKLQASASEMGNVIKITNTADGVIQHEFRTGADMNLVTDIAFSPDDSILAVAKTTGEVQVFMLLKEGPFKNTKSWFKGSLGWMMSYFGHEWAASTLQLSRANRSQYFIKDTNDLIVYSQEGPAYRIDVNLDEENRKIDMVNSLEYKLDF